MAPLRILLVLVCLAVVHESPALRAQEAEAPSGPSSDPRPVTRDDIPQTSGTADTRGELNLWWLLWQGGVIMIPIGLASLVTVALILERSIALRKERILPEELARELGRRVNSGRLLDPREAYRLCQEHPSPASRVLRAMLLNVGRPQSELVNTVQFACQREANRLHANVHWLNMITAVAPLLGLLGTVWGMILSFYELTQLTPDQNKATFLASGIYTALVTTLGGLTVAIPSAVAAHLFEGRIVGQLHRVEELADSLLPQWERFEGRLRVTLAPSGSLEVEEPASVVPQPAK